MAETTTPETESISSEIKPIQRKPHARRALKIKYKESLQKAIQEGEFDVLTQLPNRRGFLRNLATEINRAKRSGQTLSVMYLDLNGLKAINDDKVNGGHDVGDMYLQAAAQVLRANLRATDVVARLGGDEFAAILPNTEIATIEKIWNGQLSSAFEASDPKVKISAGASTLNPETDPDGILTLKSADEKLYLAKDIAHKTGQCPLVTKR